MKVMVLAGGPDRERDVSLRSGQQVKLGLEAAGHEVRLGDLMPDDLSALDEFAQWPGDVIFPIFHGKWGEGGPAQALLAERGFHFVGCEETAARLCFDKARTKKTLLDQGLPTPTYELVPTAEQPRLKAPLVIKPNDDGSSIDLRLCPDAQSIEDAWFDLSPRYPTLLVERLIDGREMTVGVIEDEQGGPQALPPIHIVPATEFYDFQAKYERDDTQYRFDSLPKEIDEDLRHLAVAVFEALGCRHLARVDLFVDGQDQPWIIEVNTLPGFTDHSLLPMAAGRSGLSMPALVDRLVRRAAGE